MTPGHTINIVPTAAHVEVRLGGRLLATTDRAMKLDETGLPSRYYLPPDDVQMDLLRLTTFHTNCPFKGEASYWSLTDGSGCRSERDVVLLPRPHRGDSRRSTASRLTHPSSSISG
jgi:uncharacterized protein (DUF427 family)